MWGYVFFFWFIYIYIFPTWSWTCRARHPVFRLRARDTSMRPNLFLLLLGLYAHALPTGGANDIEESSFIQVADSLRDGNRVLAG